MTKHPNTNDMTTARAWAEHIVNTPETSLPMETAAANALMALLPPRPTLADMTAEEREACDGMQADLAQGDRVIILYGTVDTDGLVQVLESTLDVYRPRPADVTPRPDLPRFVWPGGTPEAPAMPEGWRLADHKVNGRVVVTKPIPGRGGRVYYVVPDAGDDMGYDWLWCDPSELAYIDGPGTPPADTPEAPALPEGWRLADHPDHGRVIVTNPTPNTDGYVRFVLPDDGDYMGFDWLVCPLDELVLLDAPTPEALHDDKDTPR